MATVVRRPKPLVISARLLTAAAGAWLAFSANLWVAPRLNAMVVGALIAAGALCALWVEEARLVTSALALWLVFSSLAGERAMGMAVWNDVAAAAIAFGLSLIPTAPEQPPRAT